MKRQRGNRAPFLVGAGAKQAVSEQRLRRAMNRVEAHVRPFRDVQQAVPSVGEVEHPEERVLVVRQLRLPVHALVQSPFAELRLTLGVQIEVDGVALKDVRSEEHTSELQSRLHLVCRLLLEKK